MLQTKEEEKRRSKDYRKNKKGFFPKQEVSTNLPILIDSKIWLPNESMKDFLDYFGYKKIWVE